MKVILIILIISQYIYSFEWSNKSNCDTIPQNSQKAYISTIKNNSDQKLDIIIIKTEIDNKNNFSHSFCCGENCYPPFLDTISYKDFGSIAPNDSIILDVDVNSTENGYSIIQVDIINKDNTSDKNSTTYSTYINSSKIEEINKKKEYVNIFPNPFNPSTNISMSGIGKCNIKIYNIEGKLVEHLFKGIINNKITINWNPQNKPSGIYFLEVFTENKTITKKINYIK